MRYLLKRKKVDELDQMYNHPHSCPNALQCSLDPNLFFLFQNYDNWIIIFFVLQNKHHAKKSRFQPHVLE